MEKKLIIRGSGNNPRCVPTPIEHEIECGRFILNASPVFTLTMLSGYRAQRVCTLTQQTELFRMDRLYIHSMSILQLKWAPAPKFCPLVIVPCGFCTLRSTLEWTDLRSLHAETHSMAFIQPAKGWMNIIRLAQRPPVCEPSKRKQKKKRAQQCFKCYRLNYVTSHRSCSIVLNCAWSQWNVLGICVSNPVFFKCI